MSLDMQCQVINHIDAIGNQEYDAYTSAYVTYELQKAKEPKRRNMLALIEKFGVNMLNYENNAEAVRLANLYIQEKIIPGRFRIDSTHLAMASIHGIDCVISYNFEHINRLKTKMLVGKINLKEGYNNIMICTSKEVIDYEL